jgi:hypothetical protein
MASLGALVIELAANTARLQGDLGRGVSMLQGFASKAKSVLGVFGIAGSAGIFVTLAKEAISFGDEIQKSSIRAGVSAGTFSQLAAAAKQTDVDIGTLSKGLKNMQVAISTAAQGGKEAQSAFRQLGINLDSLRAASPDAQLKRVADALKEVADPAERARLGTAALGKAYLDLVPLLDQGSAGISNLVEEQRRLGNTFSDEQIKKLADTDDAIKRLKASWSGFATTLVSEVAPALTKVFDYFSKPIPAQDQVKQLEFYLKNSAPGSASYDDILKRLEAARASAAKESKFNFYNAPRGHGGLTPEQQAQVAEFRRLAEAQRAAAEKAAQEWATMRKRMIDSHKGDSVLDAGYSLRSGGVTSVLDPKELERTRGDYEGFLDAIKTTTDNSLDHITKKFDEDSKMWSAFTEEAARNMQDALADFLFDPFKDGLKGMLKGFIDVIRRMIAEAAAARIFEAIGASSKKSGLGGFLGSLIGAYGGTKAQGGPLQSGKWYIAGEKGPEAVWGGGAGAFAMGYGGGGGVVIAPNYHIDARGATTDLIQQLPAVLRANNDALKADIMDTLSRRPPPSRR